MKSSFNKNALRILVIGLAVLGLAACGPESANMVENVTPELSTTSEALLAAGPVSSYKFISSPGDYIGQGKTASFVAPTASISISGQADYVTVRITSGDEWWYVNIAAPKGRVLLPGDYTKAQRAPFRTGTAPGLDVWGDGRGCNTVFGRFTINQISSDAAGNVNMIDASFEQYCENPAAAPLKGTVKYNARPLSYSFHSDVGDYIGQGTSNSYFGNTSTFLLESAGTTRIEFGVQGKGDWWYGLIEAPQGQTLKPGIYSTRRSADAIHAGLDVFGDGRGCNQSSGSINIQEIEFDALGNPIRLAASFTQHCEKSAPALHGTILIVP